MTYDHNITSAEELLISLCKTDFTPEQTQRIRSLASTMSDWGSLLTPAGNHGIGALVYNNIQKLGILHLVPEEGQRYLKNISMLSLARNTRHLAGMQKVLPVLNNAGIKTVLLKGLALELTVYGNIGSRQMTDVDILVPAEDCLKARQLILESGFKSLPLKSPLHNPIIKYTGKHLPALFDNDFYLEIHHDLFGRSSHELTRKFLDSSIKLNLNEITAYVPDDQLFFLYLIQHLDYHEKNNESQLRLYADLVALAERNAEGILNGDLLRISVNAGMNQVVRQKLELLSHFWGLEIKQLYPGSGGINNDSLVQFIAFLRKPKGNTPPDGSQSYRSTIQKIPGVHRKSLYILGDLFPSIEFMKRRYHCTAAWKAVLYYPHRFGKLWYLIKGGKKRGG